MTGAPGVCLAPGVWIRRPQMKTLRLIVVARSHGVVVGRSRFRSSAAQPDRPECNDEGARPRRSHWNDRRRRHHRRHDWRPAALLHERARSVHGDRRRYTHQPWQRRAWSDVQRRIVRPVPLAAEHRGHLPECHDLSDGRAEPAGRGCERYGRVERDSVLRDCGRSYT